MVGVGLGADVFMLIGTAPNECSFTWYTVMFAACAGSIAAASAAFDWSRTAATSRDAIIMNNANSVFIAKPSF